MKYRTILFLNLASLFEAFMVKFLLNEKILVCNLTCLDSFYEIIALVSVKNILILGAYQMYFWPQKNYEPSKRISLQPTAIDRWIPAIPQAYWIYAPLYYIIFDLGFLCLKDYKISMLNAWIMLLHASFWFINFPTGIDKEFREAIKNAPMDRITRFIMDLVHNHDSEDNACPSMHCAFAVYISCIIYPFYPTLAIVFPLLIALSCLVCKQHLLIDIIPGMAFGGLHGWINTMMNK